MRALLTLGLVATLVAGAMAQAPAELKVGDVSAAQVAVLRDEIAATGTIALLVATWLSHQKSS